MGDDVLDGGDGDDILNGGVGNDTLITKSGFDTVNGGDGDDRIIFGLIAQGGTRTIAGGAGIDTLVLDTSLGPSFAAQSLATMSGIERITWSPSFDYIYGFFGTFANLQSFVGTGLEFVGTDNLDTPRSPSPASRVAPTISPRCR